jgi:hypothetical protein
MRATCSLSLCPSFLLDSSLLPIGCWNLQIVRKRIGQCKATHSDAFAASQSVLWNRNQNPKPESEPEP